MSFSLEKFYVKYKRFKKWFLLILEDGIFNYIPEEVSSLPKQLKPLEKIEQSIDDIDLSKIVDLTLQKYQLLKMPVIYHNINIYTEELRGIIKKLQNNLELENKYKLNALQEIYIIDFYIDKGIMLDREYTTNNFLQTVKIVMKYYYTNLEAKQSDYSIKYNLRILKYIIQNLEDIINSLNSYSRGE